MKRTPLNRKTPLRRGTSQLKRTRLKPVSDKRRKVKREVDPHRRHYVDETPLCERCYAVKPTDCHEIAAGAHRHRAERRANCWLALCRPCHDVVQGRPFAEQFELKVEAVRRAINWCLGRNEL